MTRNALDRLNGALAEITAQAAQDKFDADHLRDAVIDSLDIYQDGMDAVEAHRAVGAAGAAAVVVEDTLHKMAERLRELHHAHVSTVEMDPAILDEAMASVGLFDLLDLG